MRLSVNQTVTASGDHEHQEGDKDQAADDIGATSVHDRAVLELIGW